MTDDETGERQRLRRQLRALSAVNRQLHAQLEAKQSAPERKPRRADSADGWLGELNSKPEPDAAELVVTDSGALWVHEGDIRRELKAGLLGPALELHLGPRRHVGAAELDQWPTGPPVEVLEAPSGPPFLVVGGQRIVLRGLPVPHPVGGGLADRLPPGPEINVFHALQGSSHRIAWSAAGGTPSMSDVSRMAKKAARKGVRGVKRLTGSNDA